MNNLLQGYSSEDEEASASLSDPAAILSSSGSLTRKSTEEEGANEKFPSQSEQNAGLTTGKNCNISRKRTSNSKKNKYLKEFYDISLSEGVRVLNAKDILNESVDKERETSVKKAISKNNWRSSINQKRKHQVK
ncbi:hypothetical protein FG386_002416 [Cryptosporidium ryanae]|uniref:uncharacterized protein n=1 Tax=Cryptosporidium ryanae TaxID=515981 RepID=UPI003519FB1E|nr:hypothetical protein FG386_002416 [Cryptosporidium ryanae]